MRTASVAIIAAAALLTARLFVQAAVSPAYVTTSAASILPAATAVHLLEPQRALRHRRSTEFGSRLGLTQRYSHGLRVFSAARTLSFRENDQEDRDAEVDDADKGIGNRRNAVVGHSPLAKVPKRIPLGEWQEAMEHARVAQLQKRGRTNHKHPYEVAADREEKSENRLPDSVDTEMVGSEEAEALEEKEEEDDGGKGKRTGRGIKVLKKWRRAVYLGPRPAKRYKKEMGERIAKWLINVYGVERLASGTGVVEVAGGAGYVSLALRDLSDGRISVTLIEPDPRLDFVTKELLSDPGFSLESRPLTPDLVKERFDIFANTSLLVSVYPHEAVETVTDFAKAANLPALIVPCCALPGLTQSSKKVPLANAEQLSWHLQNRDPKLLPFKLRYKSPESLPSLSNYLASISRDSRQTARRILEPLLLGPSTGPKSYEILQGITDTLLLRIPELQLITGAEEEQVEELPKSLKSQQEIIRELEREAHKNSDGDPETEASRQSLEALMEWGQSLELPGVKNLEIKSVEGAGRGVFAAKDLRPNERILAVPMEHVIYDEPGSGLEDDENASLYYEDAPWNVRLACTLLREKRKGARSAFFSYIQALPKIVPSPINTFEWEQISQIEYGPAKNKLFEAHHVTSESYERLSREAHSASTREEYEWALSIVHSRTFRIPNTEKRILVPIVDMLNHRGRETLRPFADGSGGVERAKVNWNVREVKGLGECFVLSSAALTPKDSELTISYGRKDNDDFFLYYGFVPMNNFDDTVQLFENFRDFHSWHLEINLSAKKRSIGNKRPNMDNPFLIEGLLSYEQFGPDNYKRAENVGIREAEKVFGFRGTGNVEKDSTSTPLVLSAHGGVDPRLFFALEFLEGGTITREYEVIREEELRSNRDPETALGSSEGNSMAAVRKSGTKSWTQKLTKSMLSTRLERTKRIAGARARDAIKKRAAQLLNEFGSSVFEDLKTLVWDDYLRERRRTLSKTREQQLLLIQSTVRQSVSTSILSSRYLPIYKQLRIAVRAEWSGVCLWDKRIDFENDLSENSLNDYINSNNELGEQQRRNGETSNLMDPLSPAVRMIIEYRVWKKL
eukprot:CAMPEP_0114492898 /NCGR_PEP_ID=MMETSP0109-20121206/3813_1 /TAXON_ID=29199 /ORGANISM="Chlorarachnion reptans, Strain CCCM449" /LENGTH=1080 /DNA_ID=CAMNT_0001669797 /DNA_START=430 /DNA_END=3668 /DNA_ORIENTATION=-